MNDARLSMLHLLLWPTLITLAVNVARLVAQQQGWIATASGGGGVWLGIVWLVPTFRRIG